jgi:hypothetical protein
MSGLASENLSSFPPLMLPLLQSSFSKSTITEQLQPNWKKQIKKLQEA